MASLAQTEIDVPLTPVRASEELTQLLPEHGLGLVEGSVPGATELVFGAPTKAFRNAVQGVARISANGSGSTIQMELDVAPGHPKAFLDGRRNRATLQELAAAATARLR